MILKSQRSGESCITKYILEAIEDESTDTITIPMGVYLVGKGFTLPSDKRLVFSRGARLKVVADIVINGTWEAGEDDWIFEMAGGSIGGDYGVSAIRPEWLGARGDGKTDDAPAFNEAAKLCARKRRILLGAKTYLIRSTIEGTMRGIEGSSQFVDSMSGGSLIVWDPIDKDTDLHPCIRISSGGRNSEYRDFTIKGRTPYTSKDLANWVDRELFQQDMYSMFAVGTSAIEVVLGATPVFKNIKTEGCKVGLMLNSTDGHITSIDCNWTGLIGVYCYRNSEDYFFQGGVITGAFCGIMIGVKHQANHNGGISALTINRVHMGFGPYGIYQVINVNKEEYDSYLSVLGINGYIEGRFEQTGEAAIKLLPKSITSGLHLTGFGMTFSVTDYIESHTRWQYSLPDSIMRPEEKQKYAAWFGSIVNSRIVGDRGYALKSNSPGALGTSYIQTLQPGNDIRGLVPKLTTIVRKIPSVSIDTSDPTVVFDIIRESANNAVTSGNLLEPENLSSWNVSKGAVVELVTDIRGIPIGSSSDVLRHLGGRMVAVKVTPDGISSPTIKILPPGGELTIDGRRSINYEFFVLSPSGKIASRIEFNANENMYSETRSTDPYEWFRVVGMESYPPNNKLKAVSFFQASATEPTYIVGLMVSYDRPSAYSPSLHAYVGSTLEIGGSSIILTDTVTSERRKICVSNGKLTVV